ncbi:hypothetical protein A2U01_0019309, partial [Trifolium medium]|nr:hypothetical protein [Trifolium medium]
MNTDAITKAEVLKLYSIVDKVHSRLLPSTTRVIICHDEARKELQRMEIQLFTMPIAKTWGNCSGSAKSPTYMKAHLNGIRSITWHDDHETQTTSTDRGQTPTTSQRASLQRIIQVLYVADPLHMGDATIL